MTSLDGLNIDIQVVGDIAMNIKKIRASINEELQNIHNEMEFVEGQWKSDASTELKNKYQNFEKKTENFDDDLKAYAEYLFNVAKEYGYVEKEITTYAESFMD